MTRTGVMAGMLLVSLARAQEVADTSINRVDDTIESALEEVTRDAEDSQYAETLLQLEENPLDVNSASVSELLQIPGFDALLATRIVEFRMDQPFRSVDELLLVDGMDFVHFLQTRGFLKVVQESAETHLQEPIRIRYTGRTTSRLVVPNGFKEGTYPGSPYKMYNRLLVQYPVTSTLTINAGGIIEKDPGETKLTDFTSGFLSFTNDRETFKCIVGDYVVEGGQGLALWRSAGLSKGGGVIACVAKNPRGVQAYTSSDENGYLRGVACEARYAQADVKVFASRKSVNATIDDNGCISSFDAAGLSRTPSELKKRGASTETMFGVGVDVAVTSGLRSGLRLYTTRFGNPVRLSAYNGFKGQSSSVGSLDFSYASDDVGMFGEIAIDRSRSIASIGGIVLKPVRLLDIACIIHSYPQQFVSLHGFGFGESGGQVQNEYGVYSSVRLVPLRRLTLSAYFDQFVFPSAGTQSLLPANGHESLLAVEIETSEKTSVQVQGKMRQQPASELSKDLFERSTALMGARRHSSIRCAFEWRISPRFRWKTRLERVDVAYAVTPGAGRGFLMYQDIRWILRPRFSVDARIVVFATDSYDSRVYEYESELRGTFANPALYGKGVRSYILGRYAYGGVEFSMKYSTTEKPGLKSFGSGADEIEGDRDSQLGVQIDITI